MVSPNIGKGHCVYRWYPSMAVVISMFITSMGIFGFLSKSHIEQTALGEDPTSNYRSLEANPKRSTDKIDRWQVEIDGLNTGDSTRVDNLVSKEQIVPNELYAKIDKEKDNVQKMLTKRLNYKTTD